MKFSHAWLSHYVDLRESPEKIGERLTLAGIPCDAVEEAPIQGAVAIYDFDIFANRPDCMNHVGLAREYAALRGVPLRLPEAKMPAGGPATKEHATIRIEDPDLCPRYSARCILGVKVGPSPDWLRERLESIGQRSINNLVDATNFVLWELGHPLHPFDLERIAERTIVVRRARAGESLTTLDGEARRLTAGMLIIADAHQPVALAGIMGGAASEIRDATRDVLLESAWFDPITTRRTARALGLRTDASHRFERGADPEATVRALDRAASLIVDVAGGSLTDPPLDVRPRPRSPRTVSFRPARVSTLLGTPMPTGEMQATLEHLAFKVTAPKSEQWEVEVPSFRHDVEREVDLIEEVARHRGYDAIPSALPLLPDSASGRQELDRTIRSTRHALLAAGLHEALNMSMVDREDGTAFAPGLSAPLAIENPLQSQAGFLRSSLMPGLLRNVAHNLNHGLPGCRLFEIGTTFRPGVEAPEEKVRAAFVFAGRGLPIHWSLPRREVDLHDARGAAELAGDLLGLSRLTFASDKIPYLEPGSALQLSVAGVRIGVVGAIAHAILQRFEIDRPVFGGEIDLEEVRRLPARDRRYRPLPRFPAVRRDLALVVGSGVTFESIEQVVRKAGSVPIADVQVFDRYRGRGIPKGCVSVAIQIVFQHSDRTLSTDEVQAAQDAIVAELGRTLDARLRGAEQS
jgi:phenylalanyl-tRNA synthetase beta chain